MQVHVDRGGLARDGKFSRNILVGSIGGTWEKVVGRYGGGGKLKDLVELKHISKWREENWLKNIRKAQKAC